MVIVVVIYFNFFHCSGEGMDLNLMLHTVKENLHFILLIIQLHLQKLSWILFQCDAFCFFKGDHAFLWLVTVVSIRG